MMFEGLPTPCYVVDEGRIRHNLEILQQLEKDTGCHVLLAQKAFSMYRLYPMIGRYISGTTASGLYEARLGYEEMGKENHVFAPAYKEADMQELVTICDHIIFNSFAQYEKYKDICQAKGVSVGIRVNPQCSTQEGHAVMHRDLESQKHSFRKFSQRGLKDYIFTHCVNKMRMIL